jgi:DNA-binding LacI/PurR family transcriptional regulator
VALARDGARPTIEDVAKLAGVSKAAVSLALNGRAGVSDVTRQRIVASAEELGWRPSARGRALSESRAFAVGLILARRPVQLASDPFFGQLLAGLESELSTAGYVLVLSVVPDAAAEADAYRRLAQDGRVDGVLLTDPRVDDPRYALVAECGLEAVVVGHPHPSAPAPGVTLEQRTAIAQAVRRLVDLGHERIAHVSGPLEFVHSQERRAAWSDALLAAGLPAGDVVEGDFTAEGGARATLQLLDGEQRPTAIFYASDLMAIAGMRTARELGLAVPEQLSVVGFDDIPFAIEVDPPLTTIRQDPVAAGAAAARLLLGRLRGEATPAFTLPAPVLVERESIAAVPAA